MEEGLRAGETLENPAYVVLARQWRAVYGFPLGQFADAGEWDEIIAFYDRCEDPPAELVRPFDMRLGARMWRAYSLWFLGYPDRARDSALETIARGLEVDTDAFAMIGVHIIAAAVERLRRNPSGVFEHLQPVLALLQETGNPAAAIALPYLGWVQACGDEVDQGAATIHQFIAGCRAAGVRQFLTKAFTHLAEIHLMAGQIEEGLEAVGQGLTEAEETGERYHEAELWRLKGELELRQGSGDPETSFQRALEVARQQQAKGWELRAATSLARLWGEQDRRGDAEAVLEKVHGWFTEGFDTPDLVDARELLDELGSPQNE